MVVVAESKKDLVECEELLNQYVTWADPDPFVQLEQKNPEKMGVANPYALAPLLLNRKINWSIGNAQMFLMEAFATTGITEFADIFNPGLSVIFPQNLIHRLQIPGMAPAPGGPVPGVETQQPVPGSASSYGPIEPSRNFPPPTLPTPSDPPAGGEPALPFKKSVASNIKDIFDEAMQGICPNCYFIAALYSRAWCNYPAFPPTPPACTNGYNITFYDNNNSGAAVTKCSTRRFPLDTNKQPACIQMTTDWELWPALYEKAYAMFLNRPPSNLPGANGTVTDPDLTNNNNLPATDSKKLWPAGDALLSLYHITKMKCDFTASNTLGRPTAFLMADLSKFGFASWYEALKIDLTAANSDLLKSQKTLYPTVAWTHPSRPACSDTVFGAGKNPYGNDLIVPKHSYSVLGALTKDSKTYIVLRNPWGPNYVGDPSGIITGFLATNSTYTPATGIPLALSRKPDGITTDGIFALESSAFTCCFKGFGWVQFR